jgi:hypothetical protein
MKYALFISFLLLGMAGCWRGGYEGFVPGEENFDQEPDAGGSDDSTGSGDGFIEPEEDRDAGTDYGDPGDDGHAGDPGDDDDADAGAADDAVNDGSDAGDDQIDQLNDTCDTAVDLSNGGSFSGNTCQATNTFDLSCTTPGKPEVFFELTLASDQSVCRLNCLSTGIITGIGTFEPQPCPGGLFVCAGPNQVECSEGIGFGPGPAGKRYWIAIEVAEPCGEYSFQAECGPI